MPLRGSDEDIKFVIRAIDDGGLRLLQTYQNLLHKIRVDEAQFARSGQLKGDKGEFLSKESSLRIIEAKKLRQVQNAAFSENERRLKREQSLASQSAQAQLSFVKRLDSAREQAYAAESRRQAKLNTSNAGYQSSRLRFANGIRNAEVAAYATEARLNQQRQVAINRMGRLQGQAITENARRSKVSGGLPGGDSVTAFSTEEALWARIRNSVIAYYAARAAGRAITGFVREGIEFNQLIETATLGVASIITASAQLKDAQGKNVTGAEALAGAYQLANEQVQKLRIAGLQTAATTEQLVEAFQQATGPGLAAGLNLDQIRKVTVQIVQAAGAIGVPFNQLNQEVRSILAATIDRNSRIAKTLLITNAQVKAAQQQNRLADFLNEKLAAFTVAGEKAATTMFVIKSNLKETFQVFAGTATKTLFDKLKVTLQNALLGTFDFTTLQISDKFQGILAAMQSLFGSIGDLITAGIEKSVRGAAALSAWFKTHKVQVDQIVESFSKMATAVGLIIADSAKFLVSLIGARTESGGIAASLNSITSVLELIDSNGRFLLGTFIAIKLAIFSMSAASETLLLSLEAHPVIATLTVIAGLLIAIKLHLDAAAIAQEALIRTEREHQLAIANTATSQVRLLRQYEDLTSQLKTLKEGTDQYEAVQDQIAEVTRELIRINPRFNDLLNDEKNSRDDVIRAMKEENTRRRENIETLLNEARAKADVARANLKLAGSSIVDKVFDFLFDTGNVERNRAKAAEQVKAAKDFVTEMQGILEDFDKASTEPSAKRLTPFRPPPVAKDTTASKLLNQRKEDNRSRLEIIRADIEKRKALLEEDFADRVGEFADETTARERFNEANQSLIIEQRDREILSQNQLRRDLKAIGKLTEADERAIDADIAKVDADAVEKRVALNRKDARDRLREARANAKDLAAEAKQAVLDAQNAINTANVDVTARINRGEISKAEGSGIVAKVIAEQKLKVEAALKSLKQFRDFLTQPQPEGTDQGTLGEIKALGEKYLPSLNVQIAETEGVVTSMNGALDKAGLAADAFKIEIGKILESGITNFFNDIVSQTKSVGDAFRDMALSIVNSIANIIAQTIAWQIVNSLLPGAAGVRPVGPSLSGGGGPTTFAASGGYIRGPGTGTSDSIPARLSAGEYVIKASRVKDLGVEVLDAINFGLSNPRVRPRGIGYASGGVVEAATGGHGGISEMRIGLERGLILGIMRSPEGSRIHVQHAVQNRNKLRQIVR